MRKIINLNKDWLFSKEKINPENIAITKMDSVMIPHTWNNIDGQDGDGKYYRGTCTYFKKLESLNLDNDEDAYLEFNGVSMSAIIVLNGKELYHHKGGYSTFRVRITDFINKSGDNELIVYADNSENRTVYPQRADFTFYGGIYRDVNLIIVNKNHFDLDYFGSNGIKVTPKMNGKVDVSCYFNQKIKDCVQLVIKDDDKIVSQKEIKISGNKCTTTLHVDNIHLWQGIKDPHLYTFIARTSNDEVKTRFGFRSFYVDPNKGFFLNGEEYPLIGVAKHQDRQGFGNALTKKMQAEDFKLIQEMGANTIRLAHYQHDQFAYDLADEMGFVLWTEIPYISEHMEEAKANTISQMKELIVQNYHHPAVCFYGLSNEITVVGGESKQIIKNHKELNKLCHKMDKTRLTTIANLFMLETDSQLNRIADLRSYNLYYGWYVGEISENDKWFDDFHQKYPKLSIGLSEYGCDANPLYQSSNPIKGDYSETYQANYHEHMLKMRQDRPYIWAMHCWNMFEFAADARAEGGTKGINQKGLVSFDRKTKKDAYYIYKAYLSKEPFVYITGRRYKMRAQNTTEIKVYSNQDNVALYVDDVLIEKKNGDKVFVFTIPISGLHKIHAVSGSLSDTIEIECVEKENLSYSCPEIMNTVNWFDKDIISRKEGYFSVFDKVSDIKKHPEASVLYERLMAETLAKFGDVAKNVKIPKILQNKMDKMTLEATLKMAGHLVKPEMVKSINDALNKVKK